MKFSLMFSEQCIKAGAGMELNLRKQIFNMNSGIPLIILLSSQSNYVVRMLYTFAEQICKSEPTTTADVVKSKDLDAVDSIGKRKVRVLQANALDGFDYEKSLIENEWLIIQNSQMVYGDEINLLESLIDKLLDKCNVLTIDEEFNLYGFLLYCFTSLTVADLFDLLKEFTKKDFLYRLCIFHFALLERTKYGIFGWATQLFDVTIDNFVSAVIHLKDLFNATPPNKTITFDAVLANVLEVAYLGDVSLVFDIKVFTTIAKWIFVGLNYSKDNLQIESIFIKYFPTSAEAFCDQIRLGIPLLNVITYLNVLGIKDCVLSGLHQYTTNHCTQNKTKKRYQTIRFLLADEQIQRNDQSLHIQKTEIRNNEENDIKFFHPMTLDEDLPKSRKGNNDFSYCINIELRILEVHKEIANQSESYLKGLLRNQNIDRIILSYFQRPASIFETMKLRFAEKNNLSYQEVECFGQLKFPEKDAECIQLAECYLLAADVDKEHFTLKNPKDHKPFTLLDTIWVIVQRRLKDQSMITNTTSFPLFHKFITKTMSSNVDQEQKRNALAIKYVPILDVYVECRGIPEEHWLLRGIKFLDFIPSMDG